VAAAGRFINYFAVPGQDWEVRCVAIWEQIALYREVSLQNI